MERKAQGKETLHSLIQSINKLCTALSFSQVYLYLGEQMTPSNGLMNHLDPWRRGWGRALSGHPSLVVVTNYSVWISLIARTVGNLRSHELLTLRIRVKDSIT